MYDIRFRKNIPFFLLLVLLAAFCATAAVADGGVTFTDIADDSASGLAYIRVPSASELILDAFRDAGFFSFFDLPLTPLKPYGAPGAAIFDYDRDGDLDLYVTNGPAAANSLFQNQLTETGALTFVDVGVAVGVDATADDSSGVCYGDIDNDGDDDLLVLSNFGPHSLFENDGDGTFSDISATSGLGGADKSSVSCAWGDVNGDGLLDVAIANCCLDMSNQFSTGTPEPFAFNQHNQLFVNTGGGVFTEVTAASGILGTRGFGLEAWDGSPTVTWAIAFVDYDLDGDVDLFHADDQAAVPNFQAGGADRGLIHVFENDGYGNFTDVTPERGLAGKPGAWMGLSFGDLDSDGHLDVFGSNLGDWAVTLLTPLDPVYGNFLTYAAGALSSRWFLGGTGGVFSDPGVGTLEATPFGWGTVTVDYDNDADLDILYHGGLLPGPVIQGAPAALLQNDGDANFSRDSAAFALSTDHERRTVQGVAAGDLDHDGAIDFVTVSNFNIPDDAAMSTYQAPWGSPFDGGRYHQFFVPTEIPFLTAWSGVIYDMGTLSVEISDGGNGNASSTVSLVGTVGLTSGGVVNRSGFGAVVTFRPEGGQAVMRPHTGGASYASQSSPELVFGLGGAERGRVDVMWPGGVENRFYGVRPGEHLRLPEIPCSFAGEWTSISEYIGCVHGALGELEDAGVIDEGEAGRLRSGAIRAFADENL